MDKKAIEIFEAQNNVRKNMEMFEDMIFENKMKLRERIGFDYKGRHYTFIRDE